MRSTESYEEIVPVNSISTNNDNHEILEPPNQSSNKATTISTSTWRRPLRNLHTVFHKLTPNLFLIWMLTSILNIMFGYDTTMFSGLQSIPSFAREFGTPTDSPPNSNQPPYALSASRASFMSSIGFAGKLLGTLAAPFPVERKGHKTTLFFACCIAFVGIVIEATSHTVAQFVAGRVVIYFSVGIIEVTIPMYQAEIVPASMRGTVVGSMQLFNQIGQILSSGVNRAFYQSAQPRGWIIPVSIQAIFPLILSFGLFLIPPSPRWLITHSRKEEAIHTLSLIRPYADVAANLHKTEADAISLALEAKTQKAPWTALIRGTNLRRTSIVVVVQAFQQFTGQGFVSQYSPRFYETVGLGDKGFDYNIASATAGWVGCLIGMIFSDVVGRRDLLIFGGIAQALFLFLVSGLGAKSHPSQADAHGLVASVVLFIFFFTGTWPPVSYALASELGSAPLREKTMGTAIAVNVVCAFIVAFCVPYLLDAIGANIGWLFGGIAVCAAIYAFFSVPETKGRSWEEMDELFEARLPASKFKSARTHGAGRRVAALEGRVDDDELEEAEVMGRERDSAS